MVTRVIRLLYKEVRGLHQAAYVVALFTLASQILAIVRDRVLAHSFGAGTELDIYYSAFRIPDLLYVLFASVLSVYVLLPFVSRARLVTEATAARVLGQVFTLFLVGYSAVAIILLLAAPWFIPWLFPQYTPEAQATVVQLTQILLLQPLFLGLSSLFGVVTQLHHRFVLYALSPLLYNVGIIIGATVLYQWFGISGLAYGVLLGALGHMLVQWPLVRHSQLSFGLVWRFEWPLIRSIFAVAVPRAITLSLGQLQLFALVILAGTMAAGSVAVLQFAHNLQSVPLAIIGMSYSVAAFPLLAELLAKGDREKYVSYVATALRHIIFWALPIAALIIVLRAQIVRVLLGSGSFNWDDTRLTAAVLAIFAIALVGQAVLLLLVRAFYAGQYTKIPLIVTGIGAVVCVSSAWYFHTAFYRYPELAAQFLSLLRLEGVTGGEVLILPVAFLCGVVIEIILLGFLFARTFGFSMGHLGHVWWQSLLAAIAAGSTAYGVLFFVVEGVNQERFLGIFIQGLAAGAAGVAATVFVYWVCQSRELFELTKSFKTRILKTDVVAPQPDIM